MSSDSDDSDDQGQSVIYDSIGEDQISIIDSTNDTDNNDTLLPQIDLEASYPKFYLPGINTDKPGDVLENEFLIGN